MLVLTGAAWCPALALAGNPTPEFLEPTVEDGKFAVEWDGGHGAFSWKGGAEDGVIFTFEVAEHPSFQHPRELYRGTDRGTYVSGLAEGLHYFRVGIVGEDHRVELWSQPLAVAIEYPPKIRVQLILAAGSIVFMLTVAAIAVGYRRTKRS